MVAVIWQSVGRHWCDLLQSEAELLEERVYPAEALSDTGPSFVVRSRRCSGGIECNLAGFPCRWAWTNPDVDPWVGATPPAA